ncbi:DUF58 domain-containing protein [Natronorubrum sp. JWXQ-INN-674]|uniref:DUF58 domain-containing protein n=2 Tax=Natronorubrum halalkaliphilum TaxID=2691917 RepID=A0A6B0VQA7_9EURY|nr:DUF58 domain-containing protein [Natronorubrum halalkaliphilum]
MADRTGNGEWGIVATLSLAGIGLAVGSQLLVAAATLPLWYVAAGVFGTRQDATVRLERRLSTEERAATAGPAADSADSSSDVVAGDPGDTVSVRTTVRNVGSEPIVDLRVIDGVPDALPVVSGSPRTCVTLEPGAETTLEYGVELRRGEYVFDDATVRTRDLTGTVAETWTDPVAGNDTVRCSPAVEAVPLGGGTNDYAGEVPTDEGGSGIEFYAVREYQSGDPVSSIDWRRYAGTRELATVEYRAERATRIVCVVDARSSQFRAATTEQPPAVELSATAAERTVETLLSTGHPAGAVVVHKNQLASVSPGTGPTTRQRATNLLRATWQSDPAGAADARTIHGDPLDELPQVLPGEAQVYLFSSFVDDQPVDLVRRLRARGYAVRVVSPDVTAGVDTDAAAPDTGADDLATRLEAVDRGTRLAETRTTGARVVDWDLERPLALVLNDAIGEVGDR